MGDNLTFHRSMIFSENRLPLCGLMLYRDSPIVTPL
jgi:hypothetical protein